MGKRIFLISIFIIGILKIVEGIDFSVESPFRQNFFIKYSFNSADKCKDEWRQLSKEEFKKKKFELSFKAISYLSELLCAYNLDLISEGIWEVSSWIEKERKFEKYLEEKYSIKLDVDTPTQGFIAYTYRF